MISSFVCVEREHSSSAKPTSTSRQQNVARAADPGRICAKSGHWHTAEKQSFRASDQP